MLYFSLLKSEEEEEKGKEGRNKMIFINVFGKELEEKKRKDVREYKVVKNWVIFFEEKKLWKVREVDLNSFVYYFLSGKDILVKFWGKGE